MARSLPFQPRDRAAYLPEADALVLADLHLGRGAATGVALPISGAVTDRAGELLCWCEPATVVLAGDVLHSFSRVSDAVAASLDELADLAAAAGAELRFVSGNHDAVLDDYCDAAPAERLGDGTVVCHGHEDPVVSADRYVVGHDHPAIEIEGRRRPCYLYGEAAYRGADVLALPAFNPLARGTAVNRLRAGDPSSPLLADVRAFSPAVRDEGADETYVFPPLSASGAYL